MPLIWKESLENQSSRIAMVASNRLILANIVTASISWCSLFYVCTHPSGGSFIFWTFRSHQSHVRVSADILYICHIQYKTVNLLGTYFVRRILNAMWFRQDLIEQFSWGLKLYEMGNWSYAPHLQQIVGGDAGQVEKRQFRSEVADDVEEKLTLAVGDVKRLASGVALNTRI